MKTHAYVRTNCRRVFQSHDVKFHGPNFKKFIYFLFAPTLIYRDTYPRTELIRWKVVAKHLLEMMGTILFMSFLFERFMLNYFWTYGKDHMSPETLIMNIFGCLIPGFMIQILSFYCLLHSWLNFTSELMTFADRMFYEDWWTSSSFKIYYRKWNVVVQDWLYEYIYKDVYEYVLKGSKTGAALVTITVSAVIHEFIIGFSFGFFYPVLLTFFNFFGSMLLFMNTHKYKNLGNIFIIFGLCTGSGLMCSLYTIEFFARLNCNVSDSTFKYFIPVSWTCNGQS